MVSNIKLNGSLAPSTGYNRVVAVPSKGVELVNYYDPDLTLEQMYANLCDDEVYEDEACMMSSTSYRTPVGMWDRAENNTYGYCIQFLYADVGGSFLINDNVTRLIKPDNEFVSGSDPTKIYEFTISKPATVYIIPYARSTYIESLNAGWTYACDTTMYTPHIPSSIELMLDRGVKVKIPTGATTYYTPFREGHAYYKHYNAGETAQIPSHSATSSTRSRAIFIVWDEVQE